MICKECAKEINTNVTQITGGVLICNECYATSKKCSHPRLRTYRDPSDGALTLVCRECGERPDFIA